jgi:hypothetical protein
MDRPSGIRVYDVLPAVIRYLVRDRRHLSTKRPRERERPTQPVLRLRG